MIGRLPRATNVLPATSRHKHSIPAYMQRGNLREVSNDVSRRAVAAHDVLGRLLEDGAGSAVGNRTRDLLAAFPDDLFMYAISLRESVGSEVGVPG